jgi:hypothetical protein
LKTEVNLSKTGGIVQGQSLTFWNLPIPHGRLIVLPALRCLCNIRT